MKLFFFLYFSEGAPIGFIWWALPAVLEAKGFSVTQTATISAIATIPWSLKFIMAPIVDVLSVKFINIKKQLLIYQIMMGAGLYFVPAAIESMNAAHITMVVAIHGIFASLQDICVDALAVKTVNENEIGKINGIMRAGSLIGRSLFGGAGVYVIHRLGLNIFTYLLMSAIWFSMIFLQKAPLKLREPQENIDILKYLKDFLKIMRQPNFWRCIGICYFATYSYNGISTVSSAMLSKAGASPLLHGLTYSFFLPLLMLTGALLAGKRLDRINDNKALKQILIANIIGSILVGITYDLTQDVYLIILSYSFFYFFIGATTATLFGYLMKNTSKIYAAIEFSIFMGVVNLSDSSTSYLAGQLIEKFNYTISTLIIGAICILTLLFLRNNKRIQYA